MKLKIYSLALVAAILCAAASVVHAGKSSGKATCVTKGIKVTTTCLGKKYTSQCKTEHDHQIANGKNFFAASYSCGWAPKPKNIPEACWPDGAKQGTQCGATAAVASKDEQ